MATTLPASAAKADPFYEHNRLILSTFINDQKFFGSKDVQDKAASIYKNLMSNEKELKERLKGKFPVSIQQMPLKFDVQEFASKTKENALTLALQKNFHKGTTNKAAWDYMTLKHSFEELEKLKNPQPKAPTVTPNNPPAGKQGQVQEQGQGTASGEVQEGNEDPRMETDQLDDMFGHGYEDEMEDFRNSVISSLIWMNHDYFDSKIRSKAQAEDKYNKMLEKEWNKQFNIIVLPEAQKDHHRPQLSTFLGSSKNFGGKDDVREAAEMIYKDLVANEKILKDKLKLATEFKKPPEITPKDYPFNLDIFINSTSDNVLTRALKAQFVKGDTSIAAWQYFTLERSNDSYHALHGTGSKAPSGQVSGQRDKDRFGPESAEKNKNLIKDNQQKGNKEERMDTSESQSGGAVTQSQTPKENVDRISEHLWRAHHHMHRFADVGFPHPDGENSDEEKEGDDSQQVILALLWTHHEYFEPKSLSRAQAEYNFYRLLQKQWRRTLRRVRMDDIKYPPFSMKDFRGIPRNRPLYAAICTVLDQPKDRKVEETAKKAAEEYHKLTVLEQHMLSQNMMTTIPQGIDIEQGQYKEIVSEMKSRFKKAASKELRAIDKFKMLPLFEYLKLKETITSQRNQIEDLASRLSGIASQQLADGDPGFTDLGDKNRPQKLGERFAELFDETWSSAYESLKPKGIDDDESDEGTMDTLQQIVKVIYDFCQEISQDQIQRLIKEMIPPVVDPTSDNTKSEGHQASEQMRAKTEQMAREYRKLVAPATVKVMQTEIFENHIKEKLLKGDEISKELVSYVEQCVDLIWYMCIQQPPMEIRWAVKGDKFNKEQFRFSGRKGKKYRMTVWPAVFLHKEGPLVAPGYAVPDK